MPKLLSGLLRAGAFGTRNADIGGGRFDKGTDALGSSGVENVIFDPYNREKSHNDAALRIIKAGVPTATVSNVLNVIKEPEVRQEVIQLARYAETAYFYVYERDGSGVGCPTRDGWQENRKLEDYIPEIAKVFAHVEVVRLGGVKMLKAW